MAKIETQNIKNQKIVEILEKYNHYEYMVYADWRAFMDYHKELQEQLKHKNLLLRHTNGLKPQHFQMLETEYEKIHYIKKYKIYRDTMVSLFTINGELDAVFEADSRGNATFFGLQEVVKKINCYFGINEPYKPANKIAYGWNFAFQKADKSCFYKGVKLYLWGCIKNYLIKNGVEFDKATSLKVRKIVGLVDIYDTAE